MKHGFGEPLIGIVFEQLVDESQRGITGHDFACAEGVFEMADERRGIDAGFKLAVFAGQVKDRQELDFRARQVSFCLLRADDQLIGDAPIAQYSEHFARIGRTRHAHQANWLRDISHL